VVGLDRVVGVGLRVMEGRGEQVIDDAGVRSIRSVVTSTGEIRVQSIAPSKKRRAARASQRGERKTSMTWPNWSMARNR
jgi:hypothetical protein